MAQKEHDLTDSQWVALKVAWGGCAYCGATGTPLQKDCVLPISRGGSYVLANVVPSCRSCNASKCNAEVTTWMRRKRLDEATGVTGAMLATSTGAVALSSQVDKKAAWALLPPW